MVSVNMIEYLAGLHQVARGNPISLSGLSNWQSVVRRWNEENGDCPSEVD